MRLRDRPEEKGGWVRPADRGLNCSGFGLFRGHSTGATLLGSLAWTERPWAGPPAGSVPQNLVQAPGPRPQCVSGPTGHHLGAPDTVPPKDTYGVLLPQHLTQICARKGPMRPCAVCSEG